MRGKGRQVTGEWQGHAKRAPSVRRGRWNRKPGSVTGLPFPGRRVAKCHLSAPSPLVTCVRLRQRALHARELKQSGTQAAQNSFQVTTMSV